MATKAKVHRGIPPVVRLLKEGWLLLGAMFGILILGLYAPALLPQNFLDVMLKIFK